VRISDYPDGSSGNIWVLTRFLPTLQKRVKLSLGNNLSVLSMNYHYF